MKLGSKLVLKYANPQNYIRMASIHRTKTDELLIKCEVRGLKMGSVPSSRRVFITVDPEFVFSRVCNAKTMQMI